MAMPSSNIGRARQKESLMVILNRAGYFDLLATRLRLVIGAVSPLRKTPWSVEISQNSGITLSCSPKLTKRRGEPRSCTP